MYNCAIDIIFILNECGFLGLVIFACYQMYKIGKN